MSNHDAGYIVSEVLEILDKKGIFNDMPVEERTDFIIEIASTVNGFDGNVYEALEGTGAKYSICYCCEKYSPNGLNEQGLCKECEKQ